VGTSGYGEEHVRFELAAERLGASMPTLRRAVRDAGLPVFVHPLDRRQKLIRTADMEALRQPQPVVDRRGKGAPLA